MQNSKQVIFFHVPKTGGTSIRNIFENNYKNFYIHQQMPLYRGHTPLFLVDNLIDLNNFFKFSVVRNPFRRTFSLYKTFCMMIRLYLFKDADISFKEFLNFARFQGSFASPISLNLTPNHPFDQSFYITNKFGEIGIDKLYKHENLNEIEKDFNIKLERLNVGKYDLDDYLNSYSQENIRLTRYLYARDFDMFEYSKNFDDSLNNIINVS